MRRSDSAIGHIVRAMPKYCPLFASMACEIVLYIVVDF